MGRVQKYAILLLFCACTQLMAQSVASEMLYIEGFEAYSQLKYCRAYKCFSNAALVDHCGAKMMLGFLHLFGDCVEKDSTKAFQFFLELANSNIYVAKFMVGFCYQHGIGIGKDSLKAKEYYEDLLADYPLPEAHFMLARIEMFKGETASKHLKMAADKGHQQAAFQLGLNYLKNTTLKMNKIREAKKYFLESINFTQGSNESISSWGQRLNWEKMRSRGNEKACQAYNLVVESRFLEAFIESIAISGFMEKCNESLYFDLIETSRNKDKRRYYLLGKFFQRQKGLANSNSLAILFFEQGVELGCGESMFSLGEICLNGKAKAKGLELIKRAAKKGYLPAKVLLEDNPHGK